MDETPDSMQPSRKPNRIFRREPPLVTPLDTPASSLKAGLAEAKRTVYLRTAWPRMQRLCQPQSGRFWVIGGRPGNYKTQLMWNLALDMASLRQRVLFVSLEEEAGAMSLSAVARYSRIPRDRIRAAQLVEDSVEFLTSGEFEALEKAEGRLRGLEMFVRLHGAETHGRSIEMVLRSACRSRFDAVFIDHLGMIAREGDSEMREIPRAVDQLRGLSRGEVVGGYRPFVCLSSPLNRDSEKDADEDRLPRMADLRGSGRIESDADLVMVVQKRNQDEESDAPDVVDGFVLKNRQGRCPVVLIFEAQGAICTVVERHRPEEPPPEHWANKENEP